VLYFQIYVVATETVHEGIALLTMVKVVIMLRQFEYNLIYAGTLDMFATEKTLEKYVQEDEEDDDPYMESDMELEESGDGGTEILISEEPTIEWEPMHKLMKEKKSVFERGVSRFEKSNNKNERQRSLNQATLGFIESKQALQHLKKATTSQHQDIYDRVERETVRLVQRFSKALEAYIISTGKHSFTKELPTNLQGMVEIEQTELMNLHQFFVLLEERGENVDHELFSSLQADECGNISFCLFKTYGEAQAYLKKKHQVLQV